MVRQANARDIGEVGVGSEVKFFRGSGSEFTDWWIFRLLDFKGVEGGV